jgi:hypothetical protein
MTDDELDRAIAQADPLAGNRLERFDFALAEEELIGEILVSGRPASPPDRRAPLTAARMRRPLRLGLAVGCVAVIAVGAALALRGAGDTSQPAYAAEAVRIAEANRRLLPTEPGWEVSYIHWEATDYGEVNFEREGGDGSSGEGLDIQWYPPDELQTRTRPHGKPIQIAGERGLEYSLGLGEFQAQLPVRDGSFVLLRGTADDEDAFRETLRSVVSTDVDTWLAAMPATVVKPAEQEAEIDRMLAGVTLPDDFDRTTVEPTGLPEDQTQLDDFVIRGAQCAWLDKWWYAQKAEDDTTAKRAAQEVIDAPRWPAVVDQGPKGALDNDFRFYAKRMEAGGVDKSVYDQEMNCIAY